MASEKGHLMGAVGTFALAACTVLLALRMIAWLVGLLIVLRGSEPKDRVPLIREYTKCRPWTTPIRKKS